MEIEGISALIGALIAGGYRFLESILHKVLPKKVHLNEDEHRMLRRLYESNILNEKVLEDIRDVLEDQVKANQKLLHIFQTLGKEPKQ